MGKHVAEQPAGVRRGDFEWFGPHERCGEFSSWVSTTFGCCREKGHDGPHHYRLYE